VEVPAAELTLDLDPVPARRGQTSRQTVGTTTHLLRLGEALLDRPPPVAGLQ
jgi:hypothetical protein